MLEFTKKKCIKFLITVVENNTHDLKSTYTLTKTDVIHYIYYNLLYNDTDLP